MREAQRPFVMRSCKRPSRFDRRSQPVSLKRSGVGDADLESARLSFERTQSLLREASVEAADR